MTTITLPRATVEQALEAMRCAVPTGKITLADWHKSIAELEAVLAQQVKHVAWMRPWPPVRAQQAEPVEPVAHLVALELERLAQDPPISGNTLAQARILMTAANVREFGLGGGAHPPAAQAQQAEPVPFGCVTVRRLSLRHENHADQYQFYPAGQSPYLDNVDECHIVYTVPPQQAEPESCAWQQDGDSESGLYSTSCGDYFSLGDGTPEDNKMSWCCYCGKRLVQELIAENEDE